MDENLNEVKPVEEEKKPKKKEDLNMQAQRKKRSFGRKLMDKFFSDDPIGVGERVKNEVIWPGLKELSYNIFMSAVSMMFWGEVRGGYNRPGNRNFRDDGYRDYGRYSETTGRGPSRDQRSRRPSYDYGEIIFQSSQAAQHALDHLRYCLDHYGRVSVADLNEVAELSSKYTDQYYGWYDLRNASVYGTSEGWVIDLPPTDPLRTH